MNAPEKLPHSPCTLGEGPIWDEENYSLIWVDITEGKVHELDVLEQRTRTLDVKDLVGSVALCDDGDLLIALKSGISLVDRKNGDIKKLLDPEEFLKDNRFNDGKCDPAGRFWIGSMNMDEETPSGNLYRLDSDLVCDRLLDELTISNGLAWSPDQKTFYHIDSPTMEVVAFNYNIDNGELTNRHTVITIPEKEGFPDGMTIDSEGMLWICHWGGWQVARWNPGTGEKLTSIKMPVSQVTCCTFGGKDYKDLYVTTARKGLTEKELKQEPEAGSTFLIKNCGHQGSAPFRFTLNDKVL